MDVAVPGEWFSEFDVLESLEQGVDRYGAFNPGQRRPDAVVNATSEREMPVVGPTDVELFWRVEHTAVPVCSPDHHEDELIRLEPLTAD